MKRIAITGSSGYLGSCLVDYFRRQDARTRILGLDIRQPGEVAPDEFVELDICNPKLAGTLESFAPDTIIHSAFVFQPMHNERKMHRINMEGGRNLLKAVASSRPARFMAISSATAFGASPDNPVPMDDAHPVQPDSRFRYAADKAELEGLIADFAVGNEDVAVSWVRPSIIGGPKMDNYLSRFIFGMPFMVQLDGFDTPIQFVHEDDVTGAIHAVLSHDGRGGFNLGPPSWTPISEIAEITNRRVFKAPLWLGRFVAWLAWTTRFPPHESPPSFVNFTRYPWVVTPSRLEAEIGYRFKYSSSDTLREIPVEQG